MDVGRGGGGGVISPAIHECKRGVCTCVIGIFSCLSTLGGLIPSPGQCVCVCAHFTASIFSVTENVNGILEHK